MPLFSERWNAPPAHECEGSHPNANRRFFTLFGVKTVMRVAHRGNRRFEGRVSRKLRICIYNARLETVAEGETAQAKLGLYEQSLKLMLRRKLCYA
jgi:hypothetical protein